MKLSFQRLGMMKIRLISLITILLLLFVLMIVTFSLINRNNNHDYEYLNNVTELRLLWHQIIQAVNNNNTKKIFDSKLKYKKLLKTLANGDAKSDLPATPFSARTILSDLTNLWNGKENSVTVVLTKLSKKSDIQLASKELMNLNSLIVNNLDKLQTAYLETTKQRFISPLLANTLAILVFLIIIRLVYLFIETNNERDREIKKRLQESESAYKQNQEAILRLLSEISELADGDLTTSATVTEDFTGAIADAINFSIEALRDLVISINNTVLQVTSAVESTRGTATQLISASERQEQEITKAGQAITNMANSVKKVSISAVNSADVAKKSVDIASKGAKAVQDIIAGMDIIREQVQETSKRIKRLGESAQEIGEIVSLIDDISNQTNILALNAAIQSATAGDAGRGFAVIADEIQRLAERSGNATKQIEAIVKTIQGDTNEAVSSMEESTSGVVSGAKIAKRAGEALTEIEQVSVQLAGQIENISQTSRSQTAVAGNIANTMNTIQEITKQTSQDTEETTSSIERLTELANELKNSVAGFKLPE
jgi:twitching motility protein PilJ